MRKCLILSTLALAPALADAQTATGQAVRSPQPAVRPLPPFDGYSVEFVATAATGIAMNGKGDVVGTAYVDTGCGPFCLPPKDTVVWRGGQRIVLPSVPGLNGIAPKAINDHGWVAGTAGFTPHAVVWIPTGDAYKAIDLGVLPGKTQSTVAGIDAQDRVLGYSSTTNFPPVGAPFLWTRQGGMVDLAALGYPNEPPIALSPGGAVSLLYSWYRLDDPGSVTPMPPSPPGFTPGGAVNTINDHGDQIRFLGSTSSSSLVYLFRFHHEGAWTMLSPTGTGSLTTYAVGSIDNQGTATATLLSTGVVAFGPDGTAQSLASLLSPAYPSSAVVRGGPRNAKGQILAQMMIGNSPRLVRLTPAYPVVANDMKVASIGMVGVFLEDPTDPGHCSPSLSAYFAANATVSVTDGSGAPVPGAVVSARFLDDYWLDEPVTGTTNAQGVVAFDHLGPCGVGAIALLVEDVEKPGLVLDRTEGVLAAHVIPN